MIFRLSSLIVLGILFGSSVHAESANPDLENFINGALKQAEQLWQAFSEEFPRDLTHLRDVLRVPMDCFEGAIEEHASELIGPGVLVAAKMKQIIFDENPDGVTTDMMSHALDVAREITSDNTLRDQLRNIFESFQTMLKKTTECLTNELNKILKK